MRSDDDKERFDPLRPITGNWVKKETDMIRKAKAVWHGSGRAGRGNLTTDSDVLADTPFSFTTRFENEKAQIPRN